MTSFPGDTLHHPIHRTANVDKGIWRVTGKEYKRLLSFTTKEEARACVVTRLRLVADEIEDQTRTPSGAYT